VDESESRRPEASGMAERIVVSDGSQAVEAAACPETDARPDQRQFLFPRMIR
jgi:hypothetical protein